MSTSIKFFADYDKEERWLNQKAAAGFLVRKAGPFYSFSLIEPGSAVVRIDYRSSMSASDFDDYVALFSDAGWQHLAGTRTSGAQYFASSGVDADAEIFSDTTSKAQRYRRALGVGAAVAFPYLVVVFVLATGSNSILGSFFSPNDWYLTPGLWQKEGWDFMGAFLFETPFVALRLGGPAMLFAGCFALLARVAYQWSLYRRATSNSHAA